MIFYATKKILKYLRTRKNKTIDIKENIMPPPKKAYLIDDISFSDDMNLSFGSIVIATRYENELERLNIPEGHRVGPYVVIGYTDNQYICLYCTSKTQFVEESNIFGYIKYDGYKYSSEFNKDGYIKLTSIKFLNKDRVIKHVGNLTNYHKIELLKKMKILEEKNTYSSYNIHVKDMALEEGDIFIYNQIYYLIIDKSKDRCYCLKLNRDDKFGNIRINGSLYSVKYDEILDDFSLDSKELYHFLRHESLKIVLEEYHKYLEYEKKKKLLQRGSLINLYNKYYYIYGEIGDSFMALRVYNQENPNMNLISICGNDYYFDFNEVITISKKIEHFKVISLATDLEMVNIKNQRLSILKEKKNNEKQKIKTHFDKSPNILPGVVVKLLIPPKNHYIVIKRLGNKILCINENNAAFGIYDGYKEFDVKNVRYEKQLSQIYFDKILGDISFFLNQSNIIDDNGIQKFYKK